MPTKARAATILVAFNQAQAELLGKAVIFTDGKAGTVDNIWFDETHELRISIRGHEGRWPISTIKLAQADPVRDNALNGGSTWCFGKTTSVHPLLFIELVAYSEVEIARDAPFLW